MCSHRSPIMELPANIVVDIISRVPIKTIIHCKCVCKKWRNLLSEPYFANLHLSRSPTGLMVHQLGSFPESDIFKLGEIQDDLNHHEFHHDPLMRFDLGLGFQHSELCLVGSINGLICLWHYASSDRTYICNPITRQFILLPDHKYIRTSYGFVTYGFGYSSKTNQYKVVRFFCGNFSSDYNPGEGEGSYTSECEVYTLGTGTWRSLGHVDYSVAFRLSGVLLNNCLHWLACDGENNAREVVCCFEMDKESFQLTNSAPEVHGVVTYRSLGLLGDCLCVCDNTSESEFAIWVMKDYGDKECWTKEIVILKNSAPEWIMYEMVRVIGVLRDGTILMLWWDDFMFSYHPGNKSLEKLDIFLRGVHDTFDAMVFVPSFFPLQNSMLENVSVF